jgi:hypothetical protein
MNESINQSIGLDQSRQQVRTAKLKDPQSNRLSNLDANEEPDRISRAVGKRECETPLLMLSTTETTPGSIF